MIETFLLGFDSREFKSSTRHVAVLRKIDALRLITKSSGHPCILSRDFSSSLESHKNGKLRAKWIGSIHSTVCRMKCVIFQFLELQLKMFHFLTVCLWVVFSVCVCVCVFWRIFCCSLMSLVVSTGTISYAERLVSVMTSYV